MLNTIYILPLPTVRIYPSESKGDCSGGSSLATHYSVCRDFAGRIILLCCNCSVFHGLQHALSMLVGSVKLPIDTPLFSIPGSGSWASAVCTARRGRPTRHSRPLATTTAFGGYFAGSYLASFKNRQDAVVLTTHKGDVKHEQVTPLSCIMLQTCAPILL